MELSKEVHGLLDRIKRLSNAQKHNIDDSYNFDMKTSYSRLDQDADISNEDLIPIEDIDFTDKETWLYVSEESSTNTESSDFFPRDMTRLSEGDACTEYESDRRKNVDTRTFTRPKKRIFRPKLIKNDEIGDQINQTKLKINGIKEELNNISIESIKIPENPFNEIEKDGSILTGPLHFKLSDPVLNHSFDKILLTASDGYDSFINMSPPSLMNSLCSSSFMDTSLLQNTSNPILASDISSRSNISEHSTEVSQDSLSEFLTPLKSSDETLTFTDTSTQNLTSTPARSNLTPRKFYPSGDSPLNATYAKRHETPDQRHLNETFDSVPKGKSIEAQISQNEANDAQMGQVVKEASRKTLDATFESNDRPQVNKSSFDSTFEAPKSRLTTFQSLAQNRNANERLWVKKAPKTIFATQNNDNEDQNMTPNLTKMYKNRENESNEGQVGKGASRNQKGSDIETFDEDLEGDFMKNEHKKLLEATFDTEKVVRSIPRRPSLKNDENKALNSSFTTLNRVRSTEKSLNLTFSQLNKTDSENDINSTFTKNKMNTFIKKPRNITNLPDTFKLSCPDINKSYTNLNEKLNRTYQKLSDSQPNLTKNIQQTILNQSLELRNSNAYDGYKNRCGSTDSLDEKSSSISSSSKESTSKILNVGDLDNLARLQEQSLHQVMSTPKPKTAMTRFWDSEVMSPIPRQDEYLSEDSDFTDFSDQCVTARSRSSRPSTGSSTTSLQQRKLVPTVPKMEIKKPQTGFTRMDKNVPTMVVKPLERTVKVPEVKPHAQSLQQPNPRIRPSGLPRPTSAQQTGIPRPVSRIPAPRFNRPHLTRPATKPVKKSNWMDGCY